LVYIQLIAEDVAVMVPIDHANLENLDVLPIALQTKDVLKPNAVKILS